MRILSVVLAASLSLLAAESAAEVRVGDRAAEFKGVVDSAGKKIKLKAFSGNVVVVTFGASWCEPCRKELPALEKVAAAYAAKKAKVTFIAVNIDSERAKGQAFMKAAGLKHVLSTFDADKSVVEAYDPPKMPSVFIIKAGVVKHVHAGYTAGDEDAIRKLIDKELTK